MGLGPRHTQHSETHPQAQARRGHTWTHVLTCTHTCACIAVHSQSVPTHPCTRTDSLAPVHTCAYTFMHVHTTPVHVYANLYMHRCPPTHGHAPALAHTHTVVHALWYVCTPVHTPGSLYHTRRHRWAPPGNSRGAETGAPRPPRTYREAPRRVHLDHAAQQALAVGRDEVRHVEHAALHLLQQLPQVVVVEGQRPLPAGDRVTAGRRDWGGPGREGAWQTAGGAGREGAWRAAGGAGRARRGVASGAGPGEDAGRAGCGRGGAGPGGSPPAARTGSPRSSTRPPCGRRTSPPAEGGAVGGRRPRVSAGHEGPRRRV